MIGGGGDAPPSNGGEFLLQLLRNQHRSNSQTAPPQHPTSSHAFPHDPAIAAVGPTMPPFLPPHHDFPANPQDFSFHPWNHSSSPPFAPHNYFLQNPTPNPHLNPAFSSPPNYASHQFNVLPNRIALGDDARTLGGFAENSKPTIVQHQEQDLIFGSLNRDIVSNDAGKFLQENLSRGTKVANSRPLHNRGLDGRLNALPINTTQTNGTRHGNSSVRREREQERNRNSNSEKHDPNGSYRAVAPPPGFSSNIKNSGNRNIGHEGSTSNQSAPMPSLSDSNVDHSKGNSGDLDRNNGLADQHDSPAPPAGSSLHSVSAIEIEESMLELHREDADKIGKDLNHSDTDDLEHHLAGSLEIVDESGEKNDRKKFFRDMDYRSDKRGQWIMGQLTRNLKSQMVCRRDIQRFNAPFLSVFESLIPAEEEKVKQKQLLTLLERLVNKEWPEARLYLYGSCANSFSFSKSDIDVCLAMELGNNDKADVLLKLADILQSDNLQNVQALTRARVPIVKLMDPDTGICCDICINNVLAVVNTKLLRDYAQIDERLRQLAFIVKHWAKSRCVNETYQGTLSSYAYVLMCIHFLQQRRPAILPCLQEMEITYRSNIDDIQCAYFDEVEKIRNFGQRNSESIAQLVWAFFHYWAYCHDYANDVISVRTGSIISKRAKDWTRRVGNDRHLICIEDPFEISHDLGRVVDRFSIRVIREEFERAARIMQNDPNPCVKLFEPYIPD